MDKSNFFDNQPIAIIGVSRSKKKFANMFFSKLINNGYTVNPNTDDINNTKCYRDITNVPEGVQSAIIITHHKHTDKILEDTIKRGIKNIWIQQKSESTRTKDIVAQNTDFNIITNSCVFMYAKPVNGMHRFHKFIKSMISKDN